MRISSLDILHISIIFVAPQDSLDSNRISNCCVNFIVNNKKVSNIICQKKVQRIQLFARQLYFPHPFLIKIATGKKGICRVGNKKIKQTPNTTTNSQYQKIQLSFYLFATDETRELKQLVVSVWPSRKKILSDVCYGVLFRSNRWQIAKNSRYSHIVNSFGISDKKEPKIVFAVVSQKVWTGRRRRLTESFVKAVVKIKCDLCGAKNLWIRRNYIEEFIFAKSLKNSIEKRKFTHTRFFFSLNKKIIFY